MLLLIPGPVQTRPEVRAAMAQDIAPWDRDFQSVYARVRERVVGIAHGTPGVHATLPIQGAGHFVTEAVLRTFVPAGSKVLIPMNGAYAQRMARLAREAGREVVPVALPDTRGATAEDILPVLESDPSIGTVAFVYNETGSGIVNDAEGIGAAVRKAGRRMVLDAVSAFGALPFRMDEHPECDALVFTSGKCLEGMPGMGFAVARIDRAEACAGNAGSWSFDLSDVLAHARRSGWGSIRFTPPVQAIAAFDVALDLYEAEGGQAARLARYRANTDALYDGIVALGLRPYLAREHQGPVIVTVHQPADPRFDLMTFVEALKRRGVLISNFYNTVAPTMRIGAIGAITPEDMRRAVQAIGAALQDVLPKAA
ncbi:2-aminoethylphosphonate--pyruvate transaminase [Neoroseomonas soli]|uniref:2-aminoethylphosphonate--pyruvate transaminase n=1 Tax=Neoroseomonas soli TaxID=1081025 RepID=A0A9X9X0Q6_9PROT|nr:2-aminoethylphosphonate--pyruvate transaminase [Neoroseomonas soli]MBR0672985.1 2-aminoethylphosphonate--pyruvate transaminase [Neoroseomonas soli]